MSKSRKERKLENLSKIEKKANEVKNSGTGTITELTRYELEVSLWKSNTDRVVDWLKSNGFSKRKDVIKILEEKCQVQEIFSLAAINCFSGHNTYRFERYHKNYKIIIETFEK